MVSLVDNAAQFSNQRNSRTRTFCSFTPSLTLHQSLPNLFVCSACVIFDLYAMLTHTQATSHDKHRCMGLLPLTYTHGVAFGDSMLSRTYVT